MNRTKNILDLLGRIFIALIFLHAGIGKIIHFEGTKQYMAAHGMPMVTFFLICAMLIEIICGLLLLIGCMTRFSAALLIVFLIPTTLIFHHTWADPMQLGHFMSNLAIIGGLLFILIHGSRKYGIDGYWKS